MRTCERFKVKKDGSSICDGPDSPYPCPDCEHVALREERTRYFYALMEIRDTFMKALEGGVLAIDYVVGGKMKDIATNALSPKKSADACACRVDADEPSHKCPIHRGA